MSRRGAILQDYGGTFPEQSTQAQRDAANYYQRDKEQAKELDFKNKQAKQKQQGDSIDYIDKLKNEKTGVNDIDIENDKQLLAAKEKMVQMQQKGAPLSEIQIFAMRELPKINNAYTLGKNYKEQVAKGMTDLEKKYGNGVDLNAVQSKAYQLMSDDIFDKDDKGNIIGYKDPNLIPKNQDYIAKIENDSKSLGTVFKPSGAFEAGVQKTDLIPIKDKFTKTDKYGNKTKYNYTGFGTIYDEPILNEQGEQTGWDVKGEAVPLGKNPDGTVIIERVMPKEQFEIATGSAAAKKDFDIKFHNYLNESGTNPDALDARAKDILERKFAYELFKKTNIHGSSFLSEEEIKAAPVKNVTNIKVNTGKPEAPSIDVYTTIEAKAKDHLDTNKYEPVTIGGKNIMGVLQANLLDDNEQDVVLKKANLANPGMNLGIDDIYVKQFPDGLWVVRAEDNTPLTKLTKTGTNTLANQPYGQKSKQKAIDEGDKEKKTEKTSSSAPKKEIKRSDIAAKAANAGYSVKEYETLLKQKGVTIKD